MNFEAARQQMVECQVLPNDVPNQALQQALRDTPRETFLPGEFHSRAYVEGEIAYADGREMLTPRDFAKLVYHADPAAGDLVLMPACGSGYGVAVLAQLAEMVVGLEQNEALATTAQDCLNNLNVSNAAIVTGDVAAGVPDQGPFDLIIIDGVVEAAPEQLLGQLKIGGRLACVMCSGPVAKGVVYTRAEDATTSVELFDSSARAILPEFAARKEFVF